MLFYTYDTLLVYGGKRKISDLSRRGKFILMGELQADLVKVRFWWISILSIILTILLAALGLVPIIKGALVSSVVLMMFGVLSPNEAYESIHWQVIILIAA